MMQRRFIANAMLVAVLAGSVWAVGCKVEKLPTREQMKDQDAEKNAQSAVSTAVAEAPVPTTDNAAMVIAACGQPASDQVINVNERDVSGTVRRMVYRNSREITLDFLPLQPNQAHTGNAAASSNTVWRFNEARVENQRLLTAANIRVYLPCAATALAKEF